ncbi:MAG: flippase-like domain-containing protein [Actinobacteria bacterium]|nr:flippase-like domain-containing protein [Actinomycetota bacterium]
MASVDDHRPAYVAPKGSESVLADELAQGPPRTATLSKKKTIIGSIVTLVVLAVVFLGLIPQFGDYNVAFESIKNMSVWWLIGLGITVIVTILVYVLPYQAAIPGLRYAPAFVIRQTSYTISNAVPAGGAVGLALQYGMLYSYRVPGSVATTGIAVTSVWSVFITLGLPILGVLAAVAAGQVQQAWVVAGLVGLASIIAAVVVLWLILRSEKSALAVGRVATKISHPVTKRMKTQPDVSDAIMKFRGEIVVVVRAHWVWITVSNVLVSLAQFMILFVSIRAVGGDRSSGFSILAAFAAFAISRLASMIPATPGGLGTVDAVLIRLLVTFGLDESVALAADLVWRAASFIPQVLLGIVTFVWWRARQARTGGI